MDNDQDLTQFVAAYTAESGIPKPGVVAAHKPATDVVRAMKTRDMKPEDITDDFVKKLSEKLPGLPKHTTAEWQAKLQSWLIKYE